MISRPDCAIASRAAMQRELGEGVVERQLLAAEMLLRAVAADLAADGDRQPLDVLELERRRCRERPSRIAAMVSPAVRPRALTAPWPVMTTRGSRARYFWAAIRFSTARTMVSTLLMSNSDFVGSLALNGTWMSKASSMAKTASTSPSESIPRSCERRVGADVRRLEHGLLGEDRDHPVPHRVLDCVGHAPSVGRTAPMV